MPYGLFVPDVPPGWGVAPYALRRIGKSVQSGTPAASESGSPTRKTPDGANVEGFEKKGQHAKAERL